MQRYYRENKDRQLSASLVNYIYMLGLQKNKLLFHSSNFSFLVFGHFWHSIMYNEVTKILRNVCLHFARQDGQDRKKPERKSRN